MAKPTARTYSQHSDDAVKLLGELIRSTRLDKRLTIAELAERAGVSRGLIQRIEAGDMGSAIGAVFEAASVLGIPLFESNASDLKAHRALLKERLSLMPQEARRSRRVLKDDF